MLSPIDSAPASARRGWRPPSSPGPPPVMIAKPASPSARADARASVVVRVVGRRARRAEDRDAGLRDGAQPPEAAGQLVAHPLHPVGVRPDDRDRRRLRVEQLFVEGGGRAGVAHEPPDDTGAAWRRARVDNLRTMADERTPTQPGAEPTKAPGAPTPEEAAAPAEPSPAPASRTPRPTPRPPDLRAPSRGASSRRTRTPRSGW